MLWSSGFFFIGLSCTNYKVQYFRRVSHLNYFRMAQVGMCALWVLVFDSQSVCLSAFLASFSHYVQLLDPDLATLPFPLRVCVPGQTQPLLVLVGGSVEPW